VRDRPASGALAVELELRDVEIEAAAYEPRIEGVAPVADQGGDVERGAESEPMPARVGLADPSCLAQPLGKVVV
jgi:hypothetical protein